MEFFGKSQTAKEETNKKMATEIINLKITNAQMQSYKDEQKMPNLQYLADRFCEDGEISYVHLKKKDVAKSDYITISSEDDSILTKLTDYPYEFEIDGKLRLASINGVKVSSNDSSYDELNERIAKLETIVENQSNEIKTLKDETIFNKRINLMNTPVNIPISQTTTDRNINIPLNGSIEDYKYIEVQLDVHWTSVTDNHQENTVFIATEQLEFNNSDTVNWGNNSTFDLKTSLYAHDNAGVACWFKDDKTLHAASSYTNRTNWNILRIRNIYGIK